MSDISTPAVSVRWPALMNRDAAQEYLSLSKWKFDQLVKAEVFEAVIVDSIIMFRRRDLDAFIDELPSANSRAAALLRCRKTAAATAARKNKAL